MADQAVDLGGARVSGTGRPPAVEAAPTDSQFLGRTRELKELRADIDRAGLNTLAGRKAPHARVLLIAGRPGSGRTALAEELVRQVTDGYPDGVLRTRLTEPDGTRVPVERAARELLGGLGLPAPAGADEDDLGEALREALADRRVVLLLDDAADAEQVDALLPATPDSLVVAVSGGPLTGISDVRPCTLGGLDTKSAVDLLERFSGSVRITVDPRSAEGLAEVCGSQPAALRLAGGWLAARPTVAVSDLAKQLRAEDGDSPPLARVLKLAYASLPPAAARILRLLALAPAGLVDPHIASGLAGCSVGAARTTLDDFVALGFLHQADAALPQYEVPGCLQPLLWSLAESQERPGELRLARARMLERTVRLLQSCRAVTETDSPLAREKLLAMPKALRFPTPRAAEEWLRARRPALLAAARLAVADGELDTLARRLMSQLVRAMVAHFGTQAAAPDLYGIHGLVLDVAERRALPREAAAALLNLGDLDARTGRTQAALARYRAALDAGRRANDPYATGRAMESVGGAHQELEDYDRAADWYGRALAQRLARDEREDAARLYGRIATAHTYAGRYGEALRNWSSALTGHRRLGDVGAQARALGEMARVQEYAGRPEEALRTCEEAAQWARRADDTRLQAAIQLRTADTLERLGDPAAARLHRAAAERLLGDGASDPETHEIEPEQDANACEIRSASPKD
ncbi:MULTISPECIES: tetratricopeptide repeat protein [Streptomyces]|uniref:tetratricopeptide repeat protein n=1 Tax=Streptomyces TaxID=1883 RepID=UPI000BCF957C|nr:MULTISPECIES: tetratricopeptide repeat protein [Streptomyces]MDX2555201.1 tetratricopeptide repeat protein [Streptomyces stelliscabiei]MDX2615554.1 tetratricopeptide repeat protein [Streptomyces stelliscabiei]MDX2639540.1 tetratricopeptide repeat protein [Streptomyces stelliscabiei]MDX2664034.1 tetratricopeptide repeat protein [Streptomyces stelliscabiei]MDX2712962.1 tetratricopeptide repeat protein [Streptomyces stelliscabiei]